MTPAIPEVPDTFTRDDAGNYVMPNGNRITPEEWVWLYSPATNQAVISYALMATMAVRHAVEALDAMERGDDEARATHLAEAKRRTRALMERLDQMPGMKP